MRQTSLQSEVRFIRNLQIPRDTKVQNRFQKRAVVNMAIYNVYISRPTRCTNACNEPLLIIKCSTCFGLLSPSSVATFLEAVS